MPIQVFHMWWNKRGGTPYVGPPSDPVRKTLVHTRSRRDRGAVFTPNGLTINWLGWLLKSFLTVVTVT